MPATRISAALLAASVLLACLGLGCGHSQVVVPDRVLKVALREYRVSPRSVRATAGPLTILVHNYGRFAHNLVVSLRGQTLGETKPIRPGESADLTLMLPPGTYLMASTILSDQALGASGTLKVFS